jgi:hypothetical protein
MKRNRHSGEGRNPVNKIIHAKRDSTLGFVCFAGCLFQLDSGLRRNDGILK